MVAIMRVASGFGGHRIVRDASIDEI